MTYDALETIGFVLGGLFLMAAGCGFAWIGLDATLTGPRVGGEGVVLSVALLAALIFFCGGLALIGIATGIVHA